MNARSTLYTLTASVENPYDPDGGTQAHWKTFSAPSDGRALLLSIAMLASWRREFGGASGARLHNDETGCEVPMHLTGNPILAGL